MGRATKVPSLVAASTRLLHYCTATTMPLPSLFFQPHAPSRFIAVYCSLPWLWLGLGLAHQNHIYLCGRFAPQSYFNFIVLLSFRIQTLVVTLHLVTPILFSLAALHEKGHEGLAMDRLTR
jgi:hypothetical protein